VAGEGEVLPLPLPAGLELPLEVGEVSAELEGEPEAEVL
jgi:hypothetical protein